MKIVRMIAIFICCTMFLFSTISIVQAQGKAQTSLGCYNTTGQSVTVWLTLANYSKIDYPNGNPGFVQDVSQIDLIASPANPPVTITGTGLAGSFQLAPGQQVIYTPPLGTAISGNFTFGEQANSDCPTGEAPNGVNLAEFTLDTNTTAYLSGSREAIDISCVNGVNCKIQGQMTGGGQWGTGVSGFNNIKSFSSDQLGVKGQSSPNAGKVGVFPPGCDNCTASFNPGCNDVWRNWGAVQKEPICVLSRDMNQTGGLVQFTLQKFYTTPQS